MLIAVQRLSGDGLALSVCFAATSPIGRGFGIPQSPRPLPENHNRSDSIALTKGLPPDEFSLIMYNFFEM